MEDKRRTDQQLTNILIRIEKDSNLSVNHLLCVIDIGTIVFRRQLTSTLPSL